MAYKICTKCGENKLATSEYFYSDERMKDGLQSACKRCYKKYRRSRKGKAYIRKYNQSEEAKIARKKYKSSKKGQITQRKLGLKNYNLTLEQYDWMFEKQNGVCAICDLPEINMRLSVDHDHKINRVRGLLCRSCNRRLEVIEDSEFKIKAEGYLKTNEITYL